MNELHGVFDKRLCNKPTYARLHNEHDGRNRDDQSAIDVLDDRATRTFLHVFLLTMVCMSLYTYNRTPCNVPSRGYPPIGGEQAVARVEQ